MYVWSHIAFLEEILQITIAERCKRGAGIWERKRENIDGKWSKRENEAREKMKIKIHNVKNETLLIKLFKYQSSTKKVR